MACLSLHRSAEAVETLLCDARETADLDGFEFAVVDQFEDRGLAHIEKLGGRLGRTQAVTHRLLLIIRHRLLLPSAEARRPSRAAMRRLPCRASGRGIHRG